MANLNDILQGLVNTDTKIIEKLDAIQDAVGEDLQDTLEELKKGSATSSIIDVNAAGFSTNGSISTDGSASVGKCASITSTTTAKTLAAATFSNVNYGRYALCLRIYTSNTTTTSNILTVTVKNGSTTILTKNLKGTDFSGGSGYVPVYASFDYSGNASSAKQALSIQINTTTVSGVVINFDYAYISLMMPAVFL